jgi:REP element-mobilizing transposase RayT
MPNHVHVLVKPLPAGEANESDTDTSVCSEDLDDTEQTRVSVSRLGSCHSLSSILKNWKGISSRQINRDRERKGSFWMDETFDHIVRSESQLLHFRNYIRENPVKAGLANAEFTLWMGEDEVPTK